MEAKELKELILQQIGVSRIAGVMSSMLTDGKMTASVVNFVLGNLSDIVEGIDLDASVSDNQDMIEAHNAVRLEKSLMDKRNSEE